MILENPMPGIFQVLPSFHAGGVEQTTLHVANILAEEGVRSFVASAGGALVKKLHPNVIHICLPLNSKNPYVIFSNLKEIKKNILHHSIQIVHARSRAPAWSAYFAAKETHTKFVTTYHGAYSQNFLKKYYNQVMSFGSPVIVASQYMKNHVKEYYPNSECVEIPSGIDTDFFSPNCADQSQIELLKSLWGLDHNSKIILLVGRFTRIKGHQILLKAASLSSFKENVHVVFVGDSQNPDLVEELKKEASSLSIKLHIHTDEKDIRPFFYMAHLVVIPTIKPEAFGRVTVEAMSMNKMVLVNDLGASSEVLNDPDWVFDHNDVNDFMKKIDNALSLDVEQGQKIGQQNRARACSQYNIKNLTKGHIDLYNAMFKAK